MARRRLLDALCALHPDHSREELLSLVLCGDVSVDGERVRDPRLLVPAERAIGISTGDGHERYVGRGGLKLEHALDVWRIDVTDKVFVDAGASTGGFTDCLLRRGARAVHAVDVGYNQLDYRLRSDPRVMVHERTNIMDFSPSLPAADAAVADLSFRSLRGAARHLIDLVSERWAILLVKPQFEWNPLPGEHFDGIVPDERLASILTDVVESLEGEGVSVLNLAESPIHGRKGNREFLAYVGAPDSVAARRATDEPKDVLVARALGATN